jgi:hypothetical protein
MTGPKVRKNVTLVLTNTTRGDATASDDQTAVWDSFTSTLDPDSGTDVTVQGRRFAFDRRSGALVNCCGAAVDQDTKVKQTGLGLLWPVGNVQKRSYPYFDQTTRRAWPMNFDGEEKIMGISTYRFVQTVPESRLGTVPGIPADLLGLGKRKGNLAVDLFFQATITMWVDPRTGVPVNQEENIRSTARTKGGAGRLTLSAANIKTTPNSQKDLVKLSGHRSVHAPDRHAPATLRPGQAPEATRQGRRFRPRRPARDTRRAQGSRPGSPRLRPVLRPVLI